MDQIPDFQQLKKLAQSPAGQQLIQFVQQQGGNEVEAAVQKAASGDYREAKEMLGRFLEQPEFKKLITQLEEQA